MIEALNLLITSLSLWSRFSINSEASASELIENLEEKIPDHIYYVVSTNTRFLRVNNSLDTDTTRWCSYGGAQDSVEGHERVKRTENVASWRHFIIKNYGRFWKHVIHYV